MLDSWTSDSSTPDGDKLWAYLIIEVWVALEGERESLGLCNESPTVEELMGRIKFHRPKVRMNFFRLHKLHGSMHCFP